MKYFVSRREPFAIKPNTLSKRGEFLPDLSRELIEQTYFAPGPGKYQDIKEHIKNETI